MLDRRGRLKAYLAKREGEKRKVAQAIADNRTLVNLSNNDSHREQYDRIVRSKPQCISCGIGCVMTCGCGEVGERSENERARGWDAYGAECHVLHMEHTRHSCGKAVYEGGVNLISTHKVGKKT